MKVDIRHEDAKKGFFGGRVKRVHITSELTEEEKYLISNNNLDGFVVADVEVDHKYGLRGVWARSLYNKKQSKTFYIDFDNEQQARIFEDDVKDGLIKLKAQINYLANDRPKSTSIEL